jgi:hypothetical protein
MFDSELIRAVCATKILESAAYRGVPLDWRLLATYIFTLAQSDDVDKYYTVDIIHQIVDYILEQRPQDGEWRVEYIRMLCNLIASDHCFLSINYNVHMVEDDRKPVYRRGSYNFLENCLIAATYLGLTSLVRSMLDNGVKNTWTYFNTPLLGAVQRDDLELSSLLLEKRASNVQSTEIEQAAQNGNTAILLLLLQSDRNTESIKETHFLCALKGAAAGGKLYTIRFLLQWALMEYRLDDLKALHTLIHHTYAKDMYTKILLQASLHGREETVEYVLNNGARLYARPKFPRHK